MLASLRIKPSSELPNRLQLLNDLSDMASKKGRGERIVSLLDLAQTTQFERFSRVHGPSFLDSVIKSVAQMLRDHVGSDATPYHVALTQFAFFAPENLTFYR
ncbi:MAG TPA: hypothetical protein DDW73_09805 [Rhizobium sp.]|jgi:GGDEF domain-containing protein|nr:hypothetical protein [Rhizobium sp.]